MSLNYLTSGHNQVLGHISLVISQGGKRLSHLSSNLENPGGKTLISLAGSHCAFCSLRGCRDWGGDI